MLKDHCGKIPVSRSGGDPEARRGACNWGATVSSWSWEVELIASRKTDGTSFRNSQDALGIMNKQRGDHRFQKL